MRGPVTKNIDMKDAYARITSPALSYGRQLSQEMARNGITIRGRHGGKKGLANDTGMSPRSLEEILNGRPPTMGEHRAIVRGMPRMRYFEELVPRTQRELELERAKFEEEKNHIHHGDPSYPLPAPPPPPTVLREVPMPPVESANVALVRDLVEDIPGMIKTIVPMREVLLVKQVDPRENGPYAVTKSMHVPRENASPPPQPVMPMIKPRNFGERIRAAREAVGLLQRECGELIGVNQSTLSAWELGQVLPDADHAAALFKEFPDLEQHMPKPPRAPARRPERSSEPESKIIVTNPTSESMIASGIAVERNGFLIATGTSQQITNQRALIRFGVALAGAKEWSREHRTAVAQLLRAAVAAGLDVASVADEIEEES